MLSTLITATTLSLHPTTSSLANQLVAAGFENVAIEVRSDRTLIWYEDRCSLDAVQGLGQVARMVAGTDLIGAIAIVPLHERLPVLGISMPAEELRPFLIKEKSPAAFAAKLSFDLNPPAPPSDMANASLWHADLALTPGYHFSDHLEAYVNPTMRIQVADGWHALGRLTLQFYPQGAALPGSLLLGGHRPIASGIDAAWILGRWDDVRCGAEGEVVGLLGDGDWRWRMRAGLVTNTVASAIGTMEYRFPRFDAFTRFGGGFFPAGDRALFLTVGHFFPKSIVELGYYRSDYGNQLRASLTTYLGPDRRPEPGPLRVEFPGPIDLAYRASAPRGGALLWPEPAAGIAWQRLTPDEIRRRVEAWRN